MWSTSHLHAPRRSHEQNHDELKTSRSSSPDDKSEPRRRSDETPRQTPATTRFLNNPSSNEHDGSRNVLAPNPALTTERPEGFSSSKRLGFFADKLTSSLSGSAKEAGANTSKSSLHPSLLLHPHSHSRAESNSTATPSLPTAGMATSSAPPNPNKSHTSPSKGSYGRTYDSKLVSREMHRLGNLAHLPSALTPQLSTAPSVASLALPPQTTMSQINVASTSTTDPWNALHVHVLPLFNGEPLRIPIEDLNTLVKRHIQSVVSSSPPRALVILENDTSELIASGMVTLNAKLSGIDDEKLVARVVEIWGFFWDQVLTYLEGVLLPLQTDPLILSLSRTPKGHRATSPNRQNATKATSNLGSSSYHIDVRSVALRSFRDRVILPPFQRLYARLSDPSRMDSFKDAKSYQQPRLQQMLLVLSSESRQLPLTFSLTTPVPHPTAGETAVRDLLRLVRNPRPQSDNKYKNSPIFQTRTPNFLSGGVPRDRRGRVAQKDMVPLQFLGSHTAGLHNDEEILGDDTPRIGGPGYAAEMERERGREFLEALRSPDLEPSNTRASMGGWGLGAGNEDSSKFADEEEEDDCPELEQIQADVERMVGMNQPETRRRMT